jgi:hypothetical protein
VAVSSHLSFKQTVPAHHPSLPPLRLCSLLLPCAPRAPGAKGPSVISSCPLCQTRRLLNGRCNGKPQQAGRADRKGGGGREGRMHRGMPLPFLLLYGLPQLTASSGGRERTGQRRRKGRSRELGSPHMPLRMGVHHYLFSRPTSRQEHRAALCLQRGLRGQLTSPARGQGRGEQHTTARSANSEAGIALAPAIHR